MHAPSRVTTKQASFPLIAAAWALLALASAPTGAREAGADDVGRRVQTLFRDTCARCHRQASRRPHGAFDFAGDLARVASDPTLIVPGDAGASPLLERITRASIGDDPETGHDVGEEAHTLIRQWIEMGAPHPPEDLATSRPPAARRFGQFHPLIVHFPVALLIAALLAEGIALLFRRPGLHATARFCLALGTLGALSASLTGWLWADAGGQSAALHRWLGVATTAFAAATCLLSVMSLRADTRAARIAYRLALFATIALLVYTGNTGGTLVYGPDHHVPPW